MPGRTYAGANGYRFGFNGKEKDDELKGTSAQYDYSFRIYDPRVGKFLSVDPLTKSYPMLTPYQFASNNPIYLIDIDGKEGESYLITKIENGKEVAIKRVVEIDLYFAVSKRSTLANSFDLDVNDQ